MILDTNLLFAKNKAVTGSASAVVQLSHVLQLDAVKNYLGSSVLNDLGKAGDMMLYMRVTSAQLAASSTAATLDIRLHKKASASSIKSGSVVLDVGVKSVKKAASIMSHCKLGAYLCKVALPKNLWGDTTKKYIGISTKVLTAKIATGKVTAWLGLADDTVKP